MEGFDNGGVVDEEVDVVDVIGGGDGCRGEGFGEDDLPCCADGGLPDCLCGGDAMGKEEGEEEYKGVHFFFLFLFLMFLCLRSVCVGVDWDYYYP